MKQLTEKRNIIGIVIASVLLMVMAFIFSGKEDFEGPHTEYSCDVKNFQLSTTVEIEKENEDFAKVSGNIFALVTDPLTMYDLAETKTAYAGDAYHFIAQDSHTIYVDNQLTVEMVGLIDFFGESYDIYDLDGEKIAHMKFNFWNTNGKMYDMDNNIIADYNSNFFFNDFSVRISENCNLDEKTVLMIMCSYYSDQNADS